MKGARFRTHRTVEMQDKIALLIIDVLGLRLP